MSATLLQMSGVVVDVVHRIRALPAPGTEAEVHATIVAPGGGFNAMLAARRAGMDVRYGGSLGTGPFADLAAAALAAAGIAMPDGRDPARDQGLCTVLVDDEGERSFIGGAGANAHLDARHLTGIDPAGCGFVLVSGYALVYPGSGPALAPWLAALGPDHCLVFDPAPVAARIPAGLLAPVLARADWVSANAAEAAALTGLAEPAEAAAALARDRRGGAVIRMGASGAILARAGQVPRALPGFPVMSVDTNGAGDAHLGWFIAGLAEGRDPADAVARANAAAALATTREGPATAPDRAELDAFLARAGGPIPHQPPEVSMTHPIPTLALSLAAVIAAGPVLAGEIRVLNWNGYGTDEAWAVEAFAAATGTRVVHDYFNSEQELLTKLRTNPGAYDVVMINSAFTPQAREEGLIQPVDVSRLPNFADISPSMAEAADLTHEGAVYGVAWTWGLTALAVNAEAFDELPTSLEVLWDPALKGRVSIRDDALEAVQLAALATGQDINAIDDLDAVRARLEALMPQVTTFWSSENDWNQFLAAGDFVAGSYWSGSAERAMGMGLPVAFVVPEEGAIGWLDGLSIAAGSQNVEAAHAFIDWMIDPEFYTRWAETGAPAPANAAAAAALPEDSFNRSVLGDPEVVARVQFMRPVSDEDRRIYLEMWQELKAR